MREVLDLQRRAAAAQGAPGYGARLRALRSLEKGVLGRSEDFVRAISEDFGGRAREETLALEVFPLVDAIRHARRNLRGWMKPRRVLPGWQFLPAGARLVYQPLGVVGIIGAWNYQLLLTLSPLVCALAAGNRAMVKPSELAPASAEKIRELARDLFPEDYVAVVTGGPEVAAEFSSLPFDHLLFTGSTRVGKLVMRAASENLTPVTLELGGKCPAVLHPSYPVVAAAERILTGKLYNAGQTCLAPDYVLLHAERKEDFIREARDIVPRMYPSLVSNPQYTRIINERHYRRLEGLLEDARAKGARVVEINPAGEACSAANRVMPPVLVDGVTDDMAVMQEEIFGPILPLATFASVDEAVRYVGERPSPLAFYYFDGNAGRTRDVLQRTRSGGVTVNDVIYHIAQHNLPFGGVGPSGMGHYHGFHGFETFSNKRAVFYQSRLAPTALLRPPYGRVARTLIRFLTGLPR